VNNFIILKIHSGYLDSFKFPLHHWGVDEFPPANPTGQDFPPLWTATTTPQPLPLP
jgi:hypothetical protein